MKKYLFKVICWDKDDNAPERHIDFEIISDEKEEAVKRALDISKKETGFVQWIKEITL